MRGVEKKRKKILMEQKCRLASNFLKFCQKTFGKSLVLKGKNHDKRIRRIYA